MKTEHTPTPWTKSSALIIRSSARPSNQSVARVTERENPEESAANAAHIVLCVNSHPALVNALQAIKALALPSATHIHQIIDDALTTSQP